MMIFKSLIFIALFFASTAFSAPSFYRWTGAEDKSAEFNHVLEVLTAKSGSPFSASDFLILEDRDLANNHFTMYIQIVAGIPVSKTSIRLWTDLRTKELIQAEASVEKADAVEKLLSLRPLSTLNTANSQKVHTQILKMVTAHIKKSGQDTLIRDLKIEDMFEDGALIRVFKAQGKHGIHTVKVLLSNKKIISSEYEEFPQGDFENATDEFSIPAKVFPIYEETDSGSLQTRVITQLKYLKKKVYQYQADLYAPLTARHYYEDFQDPILGLTNEGQSQGYWSNTDLKEKAAILRKKLPQRENSFAAGKIILEGRYATINIHPDAIKNFTGIGFTPEKSTLFKPEWVETNLNGKDTHELVPATGYLGKPLLSFEEAFERPAVRLADHDPVQYLNSGFDEIQVYYAINTLFDSLHAMGFSDPELSTRPFHAFLFDPAINYRNNAYYYDDMINFTTYTPTAVNYARDNPTIWHELGHGIMDRLMGDYLNLADTGGLSEGMADFVAALVIDHTTKGRPFEGWQEFRIINQMGFHLTNEVHDDGEAYGGAMRDLMVAAIAKYGREGSTKVGDLTLEAMRLCRNHPNLTAEDWFNHMLFADELGHEPVRQAGELKDLILASLGQRNFVFGEQKPASFKIVYNGEAIESGSVGSRSRPLPVTLAPEETATYPMQITVTDGDIYKYQFPLTIRVRYEDGPLQGALHWEGQENKFVDYTLNSASDAVNVDLKISGTCDYANQTVGCSDYAYIQVLQNPSARPMAKKRFYLRLKPK